jgi:hypothetical protein
MYMVKNANTKSRTKAKPKKKKGRVKKKKDESLNVEIQLNKKLAITKEEPEDTKEVLEKLKLEHIRLSTLHIEYSEKLENVDSELNKVITEIIRIGNKYTSIDEFISKNELDNISLNKKVSNSTLDE